MSFPPGTEMFQFPGFASLSLCIQDEDTWLASPMTSPPAGDDIDKASGGLPHSEIPGSKPIPGSPELIAGYHVLHRLLLPRHPPNALLALDPIQRAQGRPFASRPLAGGHIAAPPALCPEVIHSLRPGSHAWVRGSG